MLFLFGCLGSCLNIAPQSDILDSKDIKVNGHFSILFIRNFNTTQPLNVNFNFPCSPDERHHHCYSATTSREYSNRRNDQPFDSRNPCSIFATIMCIETLILDSGSGTSQAHVRTRIVSHRIMGHRGSGTGQVTDFFSWFLRAVEALLTIGLACAFWKAGVDANWTSIWECLGKEKGNLICDPVLSYL
jgi:hypothetical protein